MLGTKQKVEPILQPGETATFQTVDRNLIAWAFDNRGRKSFERVFSGFYNVEAVTFVGCENCFKHIALGENVLVFEKEPKSRTAAAKSAGRILLCSYQCQRQKHSFTPFRTSRQVQQHQKARGPKRHC